MSEVITQDCDFCEKSFKPNQMIGLLCKPCNSETQVCNECENRVYKDRINSDGDCDSCEDKIKCEGDCGEKFHTDELRNGKCDSCNEVSMDPLEDLCEIGDCENTSYIQHNGLSHCRNCYDISD